jgi:mono/diheme cytochrome c family protein
VPHAFASNVFPVMQQQCIGCHSATNPQGGYVLDNYTSISEHIELILKTINHEAGVVPMPYQTDKLNDTLIQIISCWNSDGTPNN